MALPPDIACSHCRRVYDNPEWDATDAAHPAWWRGEEHGFRKAVDAVEKLLNGTHNPKGVTVLQEWNALRSRLHRIGQLLKTLREPEHDGSIMSLCGVTSLQVITLRNIAWENQPRLRAQPQPVQDHWIVLAER